MAKPIQRVSDLEHSYRCNRVVLFASYLAFGSLQAAGSWINTSIDWRLQYYSDAVWCVCVCVCVCRTSFRSIQLNPVQRHSVKMTIILIATKWVRAPKHAIMLIILTKMRQPIPMSICYFTRWFCTLSHIFCTPNANVISLWSISVTHVNIFTQVVVPFAIYNRNFLLMQTNRSGFVIADVGTKRKM